MIFSSEEMDYFASVKDVEKRRKLMEYAARRRGHYEPWMEDLDSPIENHQDVGEIPWQNVDWDRRQRCENDLKLFCTTYRPETFSLPFAEYHDEMFVGIEQTVNNATKQAIGVPRGGGKTRTLVTAAIKNALYGDARFIQVIGADAESAAEVQEMIFTALVTNERIIQDFPEVCIPLMALEREARRCAAQKHLGRSTAIRMSSRILRFATIKVESGEVPERCWDKVVDHRGFTRTSGSIIRSTGIMSRVRGGAATTQLGDELRPDWVVVDDFQTRVSASSPVRVEKRLKIINEDLTHLGGPDCPCGMLITSTIMYVNDGADQLLNRDLYPEFRGIRRQMLPEMPKNEKALNKYLAKVTELQLTYADDAEKEIHERNKYYIEHQEEIEKGARASWNERFSIKKGEVSAIQAAIHWMQRPESFWCECQNDPAMMTNRDSVKVDRTLIMRSVHDEPERVAPDFVDKLVAAIDIQSYGFWWEVTGASMEFKVANIEYGVFPDQDGAINFQKEQLPNKLHPEIKDKETRIALGLNEFIPWLLRKRWRKPNGKQIKLDLVVVDSANWRDAIISKLKEFNDGRLKPYRGQYVGPGKPSMSSWPLREDDDLRGFHWFEQRAVRGKEDQQLVFDSNHWKSELHTLVGSGHYTLYTDPNPNRHKMRADHFLSENDRVLTDQSTKQDYRIWTAPVSNPQNEYFDTGYAALGALSYVGCKRPNAHVFTVDQLEKEPEVINVIEYE